MAAKASHLMGSLYNKRNDKYQHLLRKSSKNSSSNGSQVSL